MKRLLIILNIVISLGTFGQDLYDIDNITTIEIYFPISSWNSVLNNYQALELDDRLMADSVIINGSVKDSVGVKYKGNSTYDVNNAKNPLNIALDYVHENQDYQGFRTLKLSNGKKDPSFIREVMSYEIARKYMQAPKANYAKVFINGNFHGVYSSVESVNKDFQKDYLFADRDNTRFKCNPEVVGSGSGSSLEYLGQDSVSYYNFYELKSDAGWQDLIDLTDVIINDFENVEMHLDIDRALWMLAFNNVLVNLDSYTGPFQQNYYLIKDDNDRMNPIVWDLNESLGGFEMINTGSQPSISDLIELDPLIRQEDSGYPLLQMILNNNTYKRMYLAHMRTILAENFANGWYEERGLELQSLISSTLDEDPNSFYTPFQFTSNLTNTVSAGTGPGSATIGIVELMDGRVSFLESNQEFIQTPPSINYISSIPLEVTPYTTPSITVSASNASAVYLGYRFKPQDAFIKIEMFDDGMHNDGFSGDGVYGAEISVDARDVQYYIYAENENAGVFSPERAEHEFYYLPVVGELVINELMASNVSSVADQDGEFDDWVELYNSGNTEINLEGYFLSDNESNLVKWQFPNVSIPSNGYLTVWLDGDNDVQTGLHTSFQLLAEGEELFLSTPNEYVVDAIFYGEQISDMSFARIPNGSGSFIIKEHTYNYNNEATSFIEASKASFIVYPNPSNSYLVIETSFAQEINIFDVLGRKKTTLKNVTQRQKINTASWSPGLYIVKKGDETQKIYIQ